MPIVYFPSKVKDAHLAHGAHIAAEDAQYDGIDSKDKVAHHAHGARIARTAQHAFDFSGPCARDTLSCIDWRFKGTCNRAIGSLVCVAASMYVCPCFSYPRSFSAFKRLCTGSAKMATFIYTVAICADAANGG